VSYSFGPGPLPEKAWPVTLKDGRLTLRPLRWRDAPRWITARRGSAGSLAPWEVTPPGERGAPPASWGSYTVTLTRLRDDAAVGNTLPFAIVLDRALVGQVTVGSLGREPAEAAYVGYWIDQAFTGRGVATRALALVLDHAFATLDLPRVEANIQPDNLASRRVVDKVGFREVELRPAHLHVAGAWRDHLRYELTRAQAAGGLLGRTRPAR
jgi:[ribosomal protein S5]-alanine N-acetyltransferase